MNVWELTPDPEAPRGQRVAKPGEFAFPIAGGERVRLRVRATGERLEVSVAAGERSASFECACALRAPVFPGFAACEGENRFYSFAAE